MMTLETLITLLYTAHRRFTSIQLDWRYRYTPSVMQIATQRYIDMNPPGSVAMLTSATPQSTDEFEVWRRVWYQKPACWREEQHMHNSRYITILCEDSWWSFSSPNTLHTNVPFEDAPSNLTVLVEQGHPADIQDSLLDVPLLDPSFLLMSHAFEILGTQHHAEREAIHVRATYQKHKESLYDAFFWATADEYYLLVDKEYGILLRYAARLNDTEYAVSAVDRVVFNAPIPPQTFVFIP